MDELLTSFGQSICEPIAEIDMDLAEITFDSFLSEGILKEIPISKNTERTI